VLLHNGQRNFADRIAVDPGVGLLRVYFQPGTEIGAAIAQISSVSTPSCASRLGDYATERYPVQCHERPRGAVDDFSKTLSEQQLYDYGVNFIRVRLFTIPDFPRCTFGGKERQIIIDIDPQALAAKGLSAAMSSARCRLPT